MSILSDLPGRLRALSYAIECDVWNTPLGSVEACRKASDEIERLAADNEELQCGGVHWWHQMREVAQLVGCHKLSDVACAVRRLQAENTELRKQLDESTAAVQHVRDQLRQATECGMHEYAELEHRHSQLLAQYTSLLAASRRLLSEATFVPLLVPLVENEKVASIVEATKAMRAVLDGIDELQPEGEHDGE